MPLMFAIASCGQRSVTTTTQTTNPQTGQVTTQTQTTTDDYGMNGNYQVYNGPGGQYAVTMINGQQMYVPYSVFQQQMAMGGYNALNDYYYSNPAYFHPYSSNFFAGYVLASALSGTYGSYYNRYHINTYHTYHVVHVRNVPAQSRNYGNYSGYNNNSSGMRSGGNMGSGMRSSGGGMRSFSGMRSSGMRSSGMRSSGMRSSRR